MIPRQIDHHAIVAKTSFEVIVVVSDEKHPLSELEYIRLKTEFNEKVMKGFSTPSTPITPRKSILEDDAVSPSTVL